MHLANTSSGAGCQELMIAFEECHAKGFLWKASGMCNDAKAELANCLKAERFKHQSENRNQVADKKDIIRRKWKEIDENS